jgi:phenylacetate-coenzyme A ligase PaaK-like adenylate-forming protein
LESYQLLKLRETIALAREASPFYRKQLAGSADVQSFEDLAGLPFTVPADLQEDERRFLRVSPREIERVVTLQTSGTTAAPKRLHFTADDLERTVDFFHHGMATMVQPGDRVLILMPGELPGSVGDLLVKGLARLDVEGIVYGLVRDAGAVLDEIVKRKVNCLVGIPVQLLAVARHPATLMIPTGQLRSVLLSADYVPDAIVREISRVWGVEVFNHYGMTEMGLGGGVECAHLCGYHLRDADLLVEIVDPVSCEPLPDGVAGEVVFTTLTRQGMPLIRYRSGDLARFLPEPCPCGTVLRRLDRVSGRIAGTVHLGVDHRLNIADLDEVLFPLPFILNYQAAVGRRDSGNELSINVATTAVLTGENSGLLHRALLEAPAVRRAVAAGALRIGTIGCGQFQPSASIKRSIIDRRKDDTC